MGHYQLSGFYSESDRKPSESYEQRNDLILKHHCGSLWRIHRRLLPEFVDDLDAECVKKRGTHDSRASVGEVTVYEVGKLRKERVWQM